MDRITATLLIIISLIISGCKDQGTSAPPGGSKADQSTNVALVIDLSKALDQITKVSAILSRQNFDTVRAEFAISNDTARAQLQNIAIGRWHLVVNAFDATNIIQYSGNADIDVVPSVVTSVSLILNPATGAISITAIWGSTLAGNALKLDGLDDYVDITNSPSLSNIDSAITMEVWVKPVNQYYNYIICKGVSNVNYSTELLDGLHPAFSLYGLVIDYTGAINFWSRLKLSTSLTADAWTHLAITYQLGEGIRIYKNGALLHSTNATGILDPGHENLRIGALINSTYHLYFKGTLDELRIWKIRRTQMEISTSMKAKLTGAENGLVGYWNFDEAPVSGILKDLSPYHNDGTLYGNPFLIRSDAY